MSMFNDISCGTKDNEQECLAHARVVSLYARKFGTGHWSFIGPSSEKKWYSIKGDSPQGIWDNIAEKMLVEFAESGCPIFRATTPLSRGQLRSKGHGQEDGVPKACVQQAAAESRGSRTCVCANTFMPWGWHSQGGKDELTSCRGTVKSAWQKPPVRLRRRKSWAARKGKWSPRSTGDSPCCGKRMGPKKCDTEEE